jgi:hypothetical protein
MWDGWGPEMEFTAFSSPRVSASHPPPRQASALRAVCVTPAGEVETVVLVPTEPRLAMMGLIAYASSTSLTRLDLLTVVELTSRLSMWATTEIAGWPNLRATRVACAMGHCRDIVHGTAVFTGAQDSAGNPLSLTAAQNAHVRDLT